MNRLLVLVCAAALGCGGAIDTGLLDGGDASAGNDGGSGKDGSAVDCQALSAKLNAEEAQAEQCCATCNSIQCAQQVPGLCCPLSVTNANSEAVKAYEADLAAFNAASCMTACPAIGCSAKPTGVCTGTGTTGTCNQF